VPWYDRQGKLINLVQYVKLLIDDEEKYRRVAQDQVGPYDVSTIWLGVSFRQPPEIFETMVFVYGKDIATRRYLTEEEAIEGHKEMVEEFRTKVQ
jgi:hypothetical protein